MSQSGYEGQSLCTYSYHPSLAPCQTVTVMLRSLSSVAVTQPANDYSSPDDVKLNSSPST